MTTHIQATLECEVCGAGWKASGWRTPEKWVWLPWEWIADEPQECPECGEADVWEVWEPEGVE